MPRRGRKQVVHDTRRCNPVKEYFIHIERNKEPRQKNRTVCYGTRKKKKKKKRHSTNTDKT